MKILISYELNLIFNDFDKFVGIFVVAVGHSNVNKVWLLITFQELHMNENCRKIVSLWQVQQQQQQYIIWYRFCFGTQSWVNFGLCFRYIIHLLTLMFLVHVCGVLSISVCFLYWQLIVTWKIVVSKNQFTEIHRTFCSLLWMW